MTRPTACPRHISGLHRLEPAGPNDTLGSIVLGATGQCLCGEPWPGFPMPPGWTWGTDEMERERRKGERK